MPLIRFALGRTGKQAYNHRAKAYLFIVMIRKNYENVVLSETNPDISGWPANIKQASLVIS